MFAGLGVFNHAHLLLLATPTFYHLWCAVQPSQAQACIGSGSLQRWWAAGVGNSFLSRAPSCLDTGHEWIQAGGERGNDDVQGKPGPVLSTLL